MRKFLLKVFVIAFFFSLSFYLEAQTPIYKNPKFTINERVKDLLSRMTLEEKIGQMCQFVGPNHIKQARKEKGKDKNVDAWGMYPGLSIADLERMVTKGEIGSFLHVTTAEETNHIQKLAMQSRLQIPVLFGDDAIHGVGLTKGATVYPVPISIAASFDTALARRIAAETAEELYSIGVRWTFAPNVDVARDARWGRVGETFGEDPLLVSKMGVGFVKGFQNGKHKVLACAKHLVAGGEPINGINGAPTDISERTLREIFFPSFKAAAEAGVATVMAAHNELNGIPCHSNKWLFDLLRKDFGFKGFVVSDWMDIERIYTRHKAASSLEGAAMLAVNAGIDMHMHGPKFFDWVLHLVKTGKISQERIDKAVERILRAKFELGLFENPFVDVNSQKKILFSAKHRQTALKAARESIVLLKNNGMLPLDKSKYEKILITGPNADNQTILGDWAVRQPGANVVTVAEGLKKFLRNKVKYFDCGNSVKHIEKSKITKAKELAKKSDLVILVLGENPLRYLPNEKTDGENVDRSKIDLPGNQLELVKEIHKTGKPIIVILINGRPLGVEWISKNVSALIEAFEPGALGGLGLAEILLGKVNPSGKLPITIPRSVGQIVNVYNHKPSQFVRGYVDANYKPLYEFGYGLSYTKFKFENLKIVPRSINKGDSAKVSVWVYNTGDRAGAEVVQLYVRDDFSSVTRPVKELKGFERIFLKPGEKKRIEFLITPDDLSFYNAEMKHVVEPGTFTIMVGNSSRDQDLIKTKLSVK